MTVGDAKKRVSAIKQYSQLGAGFKIAMRDLEIRGAGNLLGTAQSGHITAVGFDLYCQLLKTAVARMKGQKSRAAWSKPNCSSISSSGRKTTSTKKRAKPARFCRAPICPKAAGGWTATGASPRPTARRTSKNCALEWRDRYGPWPPPVERLLLATEIKIAASAGAHPRRRNAGGQADAPAGAGLHHGKRQVSPLDRPRRQFLSSAK